MRVMNSVAVALLLGLNAPFVASSTGFGGFAAAAQRQDQREQTESDKHINHVMYEGGDTPRGMGFLPIAIGEAQLAQLHATLGLEERESLEAMKTHARHVLHTVDPSQVSEGPGMGYGVKRATEQLVMHVELAASAGDATDAAKMHVPHVARAARNTTGWVGEIAALAERIEATTSTSQAAPLMESLKTLADQLLDGNDANKDGTVGVQEGGLWMAEEHMARLLRAQDLSSKESVEGNLR